MVKASGYLSRCHIGTSKITRSFLMKKKIITAFVILFAIVALALVIRAHMDAVPGTDAFSKNIRMIHYPRH